jgi:DegV family protein with EDD domain
MARVGIVTTSVADLTREQAEEFDIALVPFYFGFEGRTYKDDFDFDRVGFYRAMRRSSEFPTTAQPTPEDVVRVYRETAQTHDEICHLELSSKYSKAYEVSLKARELCPDLKIEVVDSLSAIGALALIAIDVAELAQKGASIPQILQRVDELRSRADIAAVFETLKYLAKGGRIHKAQALLGSILSIKPILSIRDGMTVPVAKVRTLQQGLEWIVERLRAELSRLGSKKLWLCFEDVDNLEWRERAKDRLLKEFMVERYWELAISPAAGAHIGPGAWAVAWLIR